MMTRRELVSSAMAVVLPQSSSSSIVIPVRHVADSRAQRRPEPFRRFWSTIWPETIRDFKRCGIQFSTDLETGEIRRSPSGRPVLTGLSHGAINVVLTDHIPMHWDNGRALRGVTTIYEGYHVCVLALSYAHGHQIPFLSVNTCIHELLHVFMQDIFENRPAGLSGDMRELRIDVYATRLWLFGDGAAIQEAARAYVERARLN